MSNESCIFGQYSDIFGLPGQGVHKFRFLGIAIVDTLLTIFAAALISMIFQLNFFLVLIILFLLGIIIHRLFCVRTTIDRLLFP